MKNDNVRRLKRFCLGLLFIFNFTSALMAQYLLVSSRNSNSVLRYDLNSGEFAGVVVSAGSGGLNLPQELNRHPDGYLLVTGRGNTAIKKYDGETGAYLGDFTSGYALDNPTKTTIRQGMIYVSQWGVAQNKVARFDLQTGVFIDEFTSEGVPNGGGHAWDRDGNLYVAQYGNGVNGRVLKFDPSGMLTGTFINSNLLQGPINLWIDKMGRMFVVDWTLGDILQFNGLNGTYQSALVNTSSNLEGVAYDSHGILFICDWTGNKIYQYNPDTETLTTFVDDVELAAPNSILISESTSSVDDVHGFESAFVVSPCPSEDEVTISYALRESTFVQIEMLNTQGQLIAQVFAGQQMAGSYHHRWKRSLSGVGKALTPSAYIVQIRAGQALHTRQVILH